MFQIANGRDAAKPKCENRSGTWFDPQLVEAFERVAASQEFWDDAAAPRSAAGDLRARAGAALRAVDEDYLDDIAAAFAQVVDSKSPYTSGHSERVTLFSDMIAEQLGLRPSAGAGSSARRCCMTSANSA